MYSSRRKTTSGSSNGLMRNTCRLCGAASYITESASQNSVRSDERRTGRRASARGSRQPDGTPRGELSRTRSRVKRCLQIRSPCFVDTQEPVCDFVRRNEHRVGAAHQQIEGLLQIANPVWHASDVRMKTNRQHARVRFELALEHRQSCRKSLDELV